MSRRDRVPVPGMSAELDRDIRRWLRAYPPRWRERRSEEVLGLLADLAGPDQVRLDRRARWDLVRHGLATRWRGRPPWWAWLRYRTLDWRIPRRYAAWAEDDIAGFWYPVRRYLGGVWWVPSLMLVQRGAEALGLLTVLVVFALGSLVLWPDHARTQARLRHVALRAGDPLLPGSFVTAEVPRARVEARSAVTGAVAFLGLLAAAGVVSTALSPKVVLTIRDPEYAAAWENVVGSFDPYRSGVLAALAVVMVCAVLGAVLGARRLRRGLARCPAQPDRTTRPVSTTGRIALAFWAVVALGLVGLEVTGRLVIGVGLVLAVGGLVLLPGAVAALVVLRPGGAAARAGLPAELAGVDVRRLMVTGHPPFSDRPAEAVTRFRGTVVEGAVVPPRPDPPYPATAYG